MYIQMMFKYGCFFYLVNVFGSVQTATTLLNLWNNSRIYELLYNALNGFPTQSILVSIRLIC